MQLQYLNNVSRLNEKSYGILNSNLANRHIVRLRHGQK
nr:MAG TPA: hypothetical protein [Caudoviricetes sp.]